MSDLYFRTDLLGELDRLQRQMSGLFEGVPSSLRSSRLGTFPHINVGTTDSTIEIVAFAPGVDPAKLDISIDKGLLSIAGERSTRQPLPEGTRQYAQERFTGSPVGHRTAATGRSRQGAGTLRRWVPADYSGQARGLRAADKSVIATLY